MQHNLRHDLRLRAAASVIYGAVYPRDEWTPVSFEEAERRETVHYRQAVEAALLARPILRDTTEQLARSSDGPPQRGTPGAANDRLMVGRAPRGTHDRGWRSLVHGLGRPEEDIASPP